MKIGRLICVGLVLATTFGAVGGDDSNTPRPQNGPAFKSSDSEPGIDRLVVAASFVLLLALAGGGTVLFSRRGGLSKFRLPSDRSGMRLLGARRVTPRLTLVKVELDHGRTIVIADNGSHLLVISDDAKPAPEDSRG